MPRFVVLRHETPPNYARPLHWDLMLEAGGALWTWALEQEPRFDATIVAWALADHRLDYLTYEGPISRNRGMVSRWDAGTYELVRQDDEELVVRMCGARLAAKATITRQGDDDQRWIVWFVPE